MVDLIKFLVDLRRIEGWLISPSIFVGRGFVESF